MSTVKWNPYPKEKPPMCGLYLVTRRNDESGEVAVDFGIYGVPSLVLIGDKPRTEPDFSTYKGYTLLAWAHLPEPYRPPEPEDMHPDAITNRKYMEGDPETVKELEIFDA